MPAKHVRLIPIRDEFFNPLAFLPYELPVSAVKATLEETHRFVYLLNKMLSRQTGIRIEDTLMPATFSGMLSEFIVRQLDRHCTTLTRNLYHNGHPDLIPAGFYPGNAVQYGHEGVEIKA